MFTRHQIPKLSIVTTLTQEIIRGGRPRASTEDWTDGCGYASSVASLSSLITIIISRWSGLVQFIVLICPHNIFLRVFLCAILHLISHQFTPFQVSSFLQITRWSYWTMTRIHHQESREFAKIKKLLNTDKMSFRIKRYVKIQMLMAGGLACHPSQRTHLQEGLGEYEIGDQSI